MVFCVEVTFEYFVVFVLFIFPDMFQDKGSQIATCHLVNAPL